MNKHRAHKAKRLEEDMEGSMSLKLTKEAIVAKNKIKKAGYDVSELIRLFLISKAEEIDKKKTEKE